MHQRPDESPDSLFPDPVGGWPDYVLGHVPAMVAYVDASRRYRYANERYFEWMGIGERSAIGSLLSDVLDPELYAFVAPDIEKAFNGIISVAERDIGQGDTTRYAQATYQPDFDERGQVRGVLIVVVDITERQRLETRLRESEQRFMAAFQHAAIGMALVLPDGQWLRVNAALCAMLGYENLELQALTFQDITHPDDLAADMELVAQLLRGERRAYHMEKRYLRKDGDVVHALLSVSLIRDEDGTPRYFVSQIQDISDRKAFEEALFRERELAEVTLKSIGDAVITTDPNLIVTSLNPIAEAMTGWSHREAIGRPMDEIFRLLDIDTRLPMPNPLRAAVDKNTIVGLATDASLLHRNGFDSPIEDSAAPIHDHAGNVIGGVLVFHDISETRALALKMAHLAHHDTLTGLPNRSLLQSRIEQAITTAGKRMHRVALLFVDIDHFKQINDTLGHGAGDHLLQSVAKRIRSRLRSEDTVSRIGGDEFVVLLPHIETNRDAAQVAEKLLENFTDPLPAEAAGLAVNFSIGISIYPEDADDAENLLRNADTAMYEAKMQGRNGFRFFNVGMDERNAARIRIEVALRRALARNELSLHYQPKIDTSRDIIIGAEALLRWQIDGEEVYTPEQFIPVAEDCGLIVPIGEWALREACRQMEAWSRLYRPLSVSVNVSALQFQHTRFFETVRSALDDSGLDATLLELELTERMVMDGGERISRLLDRIKHTGVTLSLDDFGTGYCSLSYLKHFPIDLLKIDRAFIRDVATDADSAAITSAIIAMARSLNKDVIAEGVETPEQADFLRAAGCPKMQGFLFGHAMPAREFEARIAASEPDKPPV